MQRGSTWARPCWCLTAAVSSTRSRWTPARAMCTGTTLPRRWGRSRKSVEWWLVGTRAVALKIKLWSRIEVVWLSNRTFHFSFTWKCNTSSYRFFVWGSKDILFVCISVAYPKFSCLFSFVRNVPRTIWSSTATGCCCRAKTVSGAWSMCVAQAEEAPAERAKLRAGTLQPHSSRSRLRAAENSVQGMIVQFREALSDAAWAMAAWPLTSVVALDLVLVLRRIPQSNFRMDRCWFKTKCNYTVITQ